MKVRFCSVQGNDVCVITVNSASEPIFFEEKGREGSMYVRVGNTTRPLSPKESVAYASAVERPLYAPIGFSPIYCGSGGLTVKRAVSERWASPSKSP